MTVFLPKDAHVLKGTSGMHAWPQHTDKLAIAIKTKESQFETTYFFCGI